MEREIQLYKSSEKVIQKSITETIKLEFPTEHKFYKMIDESNWFARGVVLFAITVKYTNTFILFEIERGKQFYTDFMPTKDCKQEYWLSDSNGIRRTALSIMLGKNVDFKEISIDQFIEERDLLLNEILNDVMSNKTKHKQ